MPNCCTSIPDYNEPLMRTPKTVSIVGRSQTIPTPASCPCSNPCEFQIDGTSNGWSGLGGPIGVDVEINCVAASYQGGMSVANGNCQQGGLSVGGDCDAVTGQGSINSLNSNCCDGMIAPGFGVYVNAKAQIISQPECPLCEADPDTSGSGDEPPCPCPRAGSAPPPPTAPSSSEAPIRYATGALQLDVDDVVIPGFGTTWGHHRSFSSKFIGGNDVGNGWNWQVAAWPRLKRIQLSSSFDPNSVPQTYVVVIGQANETLWFQERASFAQYFYIPYFLTKEKLTYDPNARIYHFYYRDGTVAVFDGSTGFLKSLTDPAGQTTSLTYTGSSTRVATITKSHTSGGTTTIDRLLNEYLDPYTNLITQVTHQQSVNGGGTWSSITRAVYTYYGYTSTTGSGGDLQTVTTQTLVNGVWTNTGTTLYRYYQALGSGGSSPGGGSSSSSSSMSSSSTGGGSVLFDHLLKYVLLPAAYDRMVADGLDPLSASDAQLSLYADFYYEYNTDQQVSKESVQGGSRTFTFAYTQSGNVADYNNWMYKTIETLPDGNQNIVYSNYAAQTILKVFQSGSDQWCTYYRYDSTGNLILQANPSAVSGFSESNADLVNWQGSTAQYLKNSSGLINTYTYDPDSGNLSGELVQQGQLGLPIIIRQYQYISCCAGGSSLSSSSLSSSSTSSGSSGGCAQPLVYFLSKLIEYPDDGSGSSSSSSSSSSGPTTANGNTRQIVTSYAYTFYPGACAVQQKTTTWPVIPTSQNGSGTAATSKEYFDTYGNLIWAMDERGFITGFTYDIPTGAMTQQIDDVDTTQVTAPAGWTTPAGGGLHLITDFQFDSQGRTTRVLGPVHTIDLNGVATLIRRANWTVYQDATFQVWQGHGYGIMGSSSSSSSSPSGGGQGGGGVPTSYVLYNPLSITITMKDGKVTDQIQAVRYAAGVSSSSSSSSSSGCPATAPLTTPGALSAFDSFLQCSYVRWTTTQYTDCCFAASQRVYKLIPATGSGVSGTNYDETDFGYDVMKRRNRSVTPGGTITRTVFEARGLPVGTWVGTNDTGATATNPAGSGPPNNMVQITGLTYDGGSAGGDGNVTSQTDYVDGTGTNDRVTAFLYDFRDRPTDTDGEIDFYERVYFDNLDRATQKDRYNTSASGNLIMRRTTAWDDRGAAFQAATYAVNPSTGVVGNSLTDNSWRDAARNVVKSLPAGSQLFTKTTFDGLGRKTVEYSGYGTDANYAAVLSVASNTILEQTGMIYDAANNVIQSTTRQRYHNAPASQLGALGNPSTTPNARVTYAAAYPDPLGRLAAMADYGTNGGAAMSRPSTIPARSDTCLVNSTTFNGRGESYLATDPAGTQTFEVFDDRGRRASLVENYIVTSSSSSSSSSANTCAAGDDKNRTTNFTYSPDNQPATITAVNATTGNQTTTYQYGTTLTESAVASSLLMRYEILPDSVNGSDQKAFTYNRQSQTTSFTDQNGSLHTYTFDKLGRQIDDGVTTLGTGVDGAVRRLQTSFEVRGLIQNLTSYDNGTVGSGNVVNDVQFAYNSFQQLVTDYQSHFGAVNVATTPNVQYAYAGGSANTVRPLSMTYPNGRVLNYDYGTPAGIDDSASRIASLIDNDGVTHLADYSYLGSSGANPPLPLGEGRGEGIIQSTHAEPAIQFTLIGLQSGNDSDTGDIYRGLDRFGRVKDLIWAPSASSSSSSSSSAAGTNLVRIQHAYDRASNRLYRADLVAENANAGLDELYGDDGLYRLTNATRGTLNTPRSAIHNPKFAQCWTLDATGNWCGFREDDTGSGTWNLIQSRTANAVNEISAITNTTGAAWAQPSYNAAGNMTTFPQPADPTKSYTGTYDAWNRLVKLVDAASGNTVQTNVYDSHNYRTIRGTYTAGVLSETRHYYYKSSWQSIEERVGASSNANRQFVWGLRFIDDLVLRDRDTTGGGTLNERLYAMQDPLGSVVGLVNSSGAVQERYAYSPYGAPTFLTSTFGARASSSFDWETLFARYRFDSATGLYPVRNRFLHWLLAWLTRDPIGYKAGLSLYGYVGSSPENWMDPFGFQPEFVGPPWSDYYQTLEIETSGETSLTFDQAWKEFRTQCNGAKSKFRNSIWTQGCVGVTQCMLGRPFRQSEWFRNCYSTLGAAMAAKRRVDCAKRGAKNLCGNASQPQVIGFTWEELPETAKKRKVCPGCGFIYWNGAPPSRVPIEGGGVFDVGFYDASLGCFWHANYNEATPDSSVLISKPDKFHPPGSKRSAVYCVICDSDELNSFVED